MRSLFVLAAGVLAIAPSVSGPVRAATPRQQPTASPGTISSQRAFLDTYCTTCHNQRLRTAELTLDAVDVTDVGAHPEIWEKVVRKLRAGSMPPAPRPRP